MVVPASSRGGSRPGVFRTRARAWSAWRWGLACALLAGCDPRYPLRVTNTDTVPLVIVAALSDGSSRSQWALEPGKSASWSFLPVREASLQISIVTPTGEAITQETGYFEPHPGVLGSPAALCLDVSRARLGTARCR